MDYSVYEIAAGINLNCFPSDNEGMSFLSVNILSQLSRETASLNAVLPFVLMKGTFSRTDGGALKTAMEAAGGMSVLPFSEKIGEIQSIGFRSAFPDAFLKPALSLLCELVSKPATRGGLLLPDYVSATCGELAGKLSDSSPDLLERCTAEMCAYEDYAVSPQGEEEEVEGINYKKLSKHYKTLLQTAPVELVYLGSADEKQLVSELRRGLNTLARSEIDYEMGTDVRLNSVEEEPRRVTAASVDGLERTALGYRFGENFFDLDHTVFELLAVLAGQKLRSDSQDRFSGIEVFNDCVKGIFAVAASAEDGEAKLDELFAGVLSAIAEGNFTDDELSAAKAELARSYAALPAEPASFSRYVLSAVLSGREPDLEDDLAGLQDISAAEVSAAAAGASPDLIYEENTDADIG